MQVLDSSLVRVATYGSLISFLNKDVSLESTFSVD